MPLSRRLSELENVLAMLVNRMVLPERRTKESAKRKGESEKGQVVFLLGAGCSRQYGLPNFRELLTYIWQESFRSLPESSWSLEMLRDELDKHWQSQGPESRQEILHFYLDRVHGDCCLGYLRLAQLAKDGYVRAFVNMNFDTLLEQALKEKGCAFRVSTGFQEVGYSGLMVYKPHGSIGDVHFGGDTYGGLGLGRSSFKKKNELILDIANSDMFADPKEQQFAQSLLSGYDVVTVGYSGIDAKIAAALRGFSETEPRNRKLFVVNVSPPDPRLLLVMAERSSQNLSILGEDGSFENFMEILVSSIGRAASSMPIFDSELHQARPERIETFMTRDERLALSQCLRLALSIRSAINVADRSPVGIEEHGQEVYDICLKLANIAGNCLTSPEKYLLHCAAYLHDLGYFAGFSGGAGMGGLALLRRHGAMTAELIRQRLHDELVTRIVPASYSEDSRETFLNMLIELCHSHAAYTVSPGKFIRDTEINISGIMVPMRFRLLHAIFAVAEHIVKEHPFLPSSDPVIGQEESRFAIDDPILDLYLRRKKDVVEFAWEKGRIMGKIVDQERLEEPSKAATWLLTMAARFILKLDAISLHHGGWGVRFLCDLPVEQLAKDRRGDPLFTPLLVDALEEDLDEALDRVQKDSMREVVGLLDQANDLLDAVRKDLNLLASEFLQAPRKDSLEIKIAPVELILEIVQEWTQLVARTIREDWISGAESSLRLIQLSAGRLGAQAPKGLGKEVAMVKSSAEKCIRYLSENAPRGLLSESGNWISLSLQLLANVRKTYEDELQFESKQNLGNVIACLSKFRKNISEYSAGEVASILDLVLIYTYSSDPEEGGDPKYPREPRVAFNRKPVERALNLVKNSKCLTHQGLLHLYLPMKQRHSSQVADICEASEVMERVFLDSFEQIIYPAWRFFARNWHDHSEAVLMARVCLDLGSSRFRAEVVGGLKYLLSDRVEQGSCMIDGQKQESAHGHDGCTLCTSRLLYILSYARRLFPQEELLKLSQNRNQKGVNETVRGILNYFLSRASGDPAWWGLETKGEYGSEVRSADYLAWSARAIAFCLAVDQEVRDKIGEDWLGGKCGLDKGKLSALLVQRWDALFEAEPRDLLSDLAEEPQTFTLGRVALAYLDLLRLGDPIRERILKAGSKVGHFLDSLDQACEEISHKHLAQMSQYYLLPVMIVRDSRLTGDQEKEESARLLVSLCQRCLGSRVWIRKGPDQGSWGFNVKNSQALITALAAFWRHAFDPVHRKRFEEAFKAQTSLHGIHSESTSVQPALESAQAVAARFDAVVTSSSESPRSSRPRRSGRPGPRRRSHPPGGGPS